MIGILLFATVKGTFLSFFLTPHFFRHADLTERQMSTVTLIFHLSVHPSNNKYKTKRKMLLLQFWNQITSASKTFSMAIHSVCKGGHPDTKEMSRLLQWIACRGQTSNALHVR